MTRFLQGYPNPATFAQPSAIFRGAQLKAIIGVGQILNGDPVNQFFWIGKIPSSAIISPRSRVLHGAATGVTAARFGVGDIVGQEGCFATAQNLATAGEKNFLAGVTTANLLRRVWQHAGLATDPGREHDLIMRLDAAATATADVHFEIWYQEAG